MALLSDTTKIGIFLTGLGWIVLCLGMLLLDGGLLAIGNLFFLGGVATIIGLSSAFRFFFQRRKLRGSLLFFAGVFLVFARHPFIGVCCELFGFINIFGNFFPQAVAFGRRIPILGDLLSLPVVDRFVDWAAGAANAPSLLPL
jgi:hypothetical protein